MRNQILNTLKLDLTKLNRENGYSTSVKEITFRALSIDEINYSNTPLIMIFALGEEIKRFEDYRISEFEIGLSCFLHSNDRDENKIKDVVENFIQDVKKWVDSDIEIIRIDGIESFDLIKISPVINAGDDFGIVEFIFKIVYVN